MKQKGPWLDVRPLCPAMQRAVAERLGHPLTRTIERCLLGMNRSKQLPDETDIDNLLCSSIIQKIIH